ncbi:hypothetical protein EDB83DRAFT_1245647 [Lactarius deliciosus]|nr:hypothetical protein EDB83DRAFT_1245647 [Lactarius deliciosus]
MEMRRSLAMCLITDAKGDVRVHCGWVFEDSFVENMYPWPDDHSKRLMVNFEGEDVLNYGGMSREWFFFLKHTIFYPNYRFSVHNDYTLPIDLAQGEHPVGHVLSPPPDRFLSAHFVPGFSKMVLNRETNPKVLEVGHAVHMAVAINHRALLDQSIKDHSSYPLSKNRDWRELARTRQASINGQVYVLLFVRRVLVPMGALEDLGHGIIKSRQQVGRFAVAQARTLGHC